MKIIVGLGNPGGKYARTRHNAGFMAIDALAESLRADIAQEKHHALLGRVRIDSQEAVLVKPQTFMNESGRAAGGVLRGSYAEIADLIVIHDELDLPLGTVRVKIGGGHGGHNGLRSLIEQLGSAEFVRVRVGIGRPDPGMDAADYVLSRFRPEEWEIVAKAIATAAEAARAVAVEGPTRAMNMFNQK